MDDVLSDWDSAKEGKQKSGMAKPKKNINASEKKDGAAGEKKSEKKEVEKKEPSDEKEEALM